MCTYRLTADAADYNTDYECLVYDEHDDIREQIEYALYNEDGAVDIILPNRPINFIEEVLAVAHELGIKVFFLKERGHVLNEIYRDKKDSADIWNSISARAIPVTLMP